MYSWNMHWRTLIPNIKCTQYSCLLLLHCFCTTIAISLMITIISIITDVFFMHILCFFYQPLWKGTTYCLMFISTFYRNIQYQIFSQKNTYIDDIYIYIMYTMLYWYLCCQKYIAKTVLECVRWFSYVLFYFLFISIWEIYLREKRWSYLNLLSKNLYVRTEN